LDLVLDLVQKNQKASNLNLKFGMNQLF